MSSWTIHSALWKLQEIHNYGNAENSHGLSFNVFLDIKDFLHFLSMDKLMSIPNTELLYLKCLRIILSHKNKDLHILYCNTIYDFLRRLLLSDNIEFKINVLDCIDTMLNNNEYPNPIIILGLECIATQFMSNNDLLRLKCINLCLKIIKKDIPPHAEQSVVYLLQPFFNTNLLRDYSSLNKALSCVYKIVNGKKVNFYSSQQVSDQIAVACLNSANNDYLFKLVNIHIVLINKFKLQTCPDLEFDEIIRMFYVRARCDTRKKQHILLSLAELYHADQRKSFITLIYRHLMTDSYSIKTLLRLFRDYVITPTGGYDLNDDSSEIVLAKIIGFATEETYYDLCVEIFEKFLNNHEKFTRSCIKIHDSHILEKMATCPLVEICHNGYLAGEVYTRFGEEFGVEINYQQGVLNSFNVPVSIANARDPSIFEEAMPVLRSMIHIDDLRPYNRKQLLSNLKLKLTSTIRIHFGVEKNSVICDCDMTSTLYEVFLKYCMSRFSLPENTKIPQLSPTYSCNVQLQNRSCNVNYLYLHFANPALFKIPLEFYKRSIDGDYTLLNRATPLLDIIFNGESPIILEKMSNETDILRYAFPPTPPLILSSQVTSYYALEFINNITLPFNQKILKYPIMQRYSHPMEAVLPSSPTVNFVCNYPWFFDYDVRLFTAQMRLLPFASKLCLHARNFNFDCIPVNLYKDFVNIPIRFECFWTDAQIALLEIKNCIVPTKFILLDEQNNPMGTSYDFFRLVSEDLLSTVIEGCYDNKMLAPNIPEIWASILGSFLAHSFLEEIPVNLNLSIHFFDLMRENPIEIDITSGEILTDSQRLELLDSSYYNSLHSRNYIGLRFFNDAIPHSKQLDVDGSIKIIKNIEDSELYISTVISYKCGEMYRNTFRPTFIKAFDRIFSSRCHSAYEELSHLFSNNELKMLFDGTTKVDYDDIEQGILPNDGYDNTSIQIRELKNILTHMYVIDRLKFVQLLTGMTVIPVGGLRSIKPMISIRKYNSNQDPNGTFPVARIFEHVLDLPPYENIETLKTMIFTLIQHPDEFRK
jgi:hypothetical protein